MMMKNADADTVSVKAIEGHAVYGGDLAGQTDDEGRRDGLVWKFTMPRGVGAPPHVHRHESMVYVVHGKVKMVVGDEEYILGPGDVCKHPAGVAHGVEAIEESVMVEIKAPTTEMSSYFEMSDRLEKLRGKRRQ